MGRISLQIAAVVYLGFVGLTSFITFLLYGFDKRRAVRGGRRIPEKTLHLYALLGGWPGAFLGQRVFRHKTSKLPFLIVFWATVVVHVVIVGSLAYKWPAAPTGSVAPSGAEQIRIEPARRQPRTPTR